MLVAPRVVNRQTDRRYHFDTPYAKRAHVRYVNDLYEDVQRMGARLLTEIGPIIERVVNFIQSGDYGSVVPLVYEVLEAFDTLNTKLTRHTHYLVLLQENNRLGSFKCFLLIFLE